MGSVTVHRHKYGEPVRFLHRTERACVRCDVVKVTRHDAGTTAPPWVEFWRGGEVIRTLRTPTCEAVT